MSQIRLATPIADAAVHGTHDRAAQYTQLVKLRVTLCSVSADANAINDGRGRKSRLQLDARINDAAADRGRGSTLYRRSRANLRGCVRWHSGALASPCREPPSSPACDLGVRVQRVRAGGLQQHISSIFAADTLLDDALHRPRARAAARRVVGSAEAARFAVGAISSCTLRWSVMAVAVLERRVPAVSASTGDHRLPLGRPSTGATGGAAGDRCGAAGEL